MILTLGPQADGTFSNFQALVGATTITAAVDDSLDTTNDGDTTYFQLANTPGLASRVSLRFFLRAEGFLIDSITMQVAMRKAAPGGGSAAILLGFCQAGAVAYDQVPVSTSTTTYVIRSKTYVSNPITGAPFTAADLNALECCMEVDPSSAAIPRISLWNIPSTLVRGPSMYRSVMSRGRRL